MTGPRIEVAPRLCRGRPYTLAIADSVRVLVVCTANQCRSPMVAALLARRLSVTGEPAVVSSAGTRASTGLPATGPAITVMGELGISLSSHRSRPLVESEVAGADLVIGMAREHVREAVVLHPPAWPQAFTLRAIVRAGLDSPRDGRAFTGWLAALDATRSIADFLGNDPHDDIADPIGRPLAQYRSTAQELDDLVTELVRIAWATRS